MPKPKRRQQQTGSESVNRAAEASVDEGGASANEDESLDSNDGGRDFDEREAGGDEAEEQEAAGRRHPTPTTFARSFRPN